MDFKNNKTLRAIGLVILGLIIYHRLGYTTSQPTQEQKEVEKDINKKLNEQA